MKNILKHKNSRLHEIEEFLSTYISMKRDTKAFSSGRLTD